jgi:aminoglycoside 3-N-acetyltransferase I
MDITARRLNANDEMVAQHLFSLMTNVFGEQQLLLRDAYLERLLASEQFWVIAAFSGGELLGGLTAHSLAMTRAESAEVFIYDIAVHEKHRRKGVGKMLVATLRKHCREQSVDAVFVPADDEDPHALDFYKAIGGNPSPVTFFTFPVID